MGSSRLMVPFFVLLLLVSMVPLSMVPFSVAEPEPQLIGGNPLVVNPPPDWPAFWTKFNKVSDWNLEYFDGSTWVSVKSDLQVVREYPEPNRVKLTLIFDASHAANYRLTFAINSAVREYVTKLDQYRYELNYGNYSVIWDWSDAIAIPGIVFTHGLQDGMFWFRMRRDSVPLGAHVEIDPSVIASYSETNQDGLLSMVDTHPSAATLSAVGQSFQNRATDTQITSAKFYLNDGGGNPDGNVIAALYAHGGVYGVSSVPTGAVLATSDPIAANTIGPAFALYTFTFPAGQQYLMTANTYYTIFVYRTATVNDVNVGTDTSAPTHGGNSFYYNAGAWTAFGNDAIFYVYGMSPPVNNALVSTPLFSRTAYGWCNLTVTDVDLVASLATVDLHVDTNGTGTLENFTLRWTQATNVFSETGDPSGICTLDATGSVRVNVDADTDQICFLFAITDATEGPCNATITTTDDDGLTDADVYVAEFTYSYWNEIADLINSAFQFFGILDYMTQITAYINGMITYFSDSLINIVLLVVQQFRFINLVFTSLLYWFTGFLTALIEFVEFFQDLLDGVSVWYNDLGALWDWVGWNTWSPVLPYILFFWWLCSMETRSRVTPGGGIQVLINDFNTAANIISYFLGVFSFVANTIIDRVYGLISAIG